MKSLLLPGGSLVTHGRSCPLCNGSTNRIPRRWIDLLQSIFVPVQRHRCRSMGCGWEGNLREK